MEDSSKIVLYYVFASRFTKYVYTYIYIVYIHTYTYLYMYRIFPIFFAWWFWDRHGLPSINLLSALRSLGKSWPMSSLDATGGQRIWRFPKVTGVPHNECCFGWKIPCTPRKWTIFNEHILFGRVHVKLPEGICTPNLWLLPQNMQMADGCCLRKNWQVTKPIAIETPSFFGRVSHGLVHITCKSQRSDPFPLWHLHQKR